MKTLTTPQRLLAIALMAGSAAAVAQTSTMPAMSASQPTTSVGVTPQAAAEANRKAVPRSDTATVVRTSPNAVDATRNAAGGNATSSGTGTAGTTGTTDTNVKAGMTPTAGSVGDTTKSRPMRKARADRN